MYTRVEGKTRKFSIFQSIYEHYERFYIPVLTIVYCIYLKNYIHINRIIY